MTFSSLLALDLSPVQLLKYQTEQSTNKLASGCVTHNALGFLPCPICKRFTVKIKKSKRSLQGSCRLLLTSTDWHRGSGVQNCSSFNKLASKWDCFETDVPFCGEHRLFCFATLITSWQVVLFCSSCLVTTFVFICCTDAVGLPGWSRGEPCVTLRASSPVWVQLRRLIDWVVLLFAAQIIHSIKLFFLNKTEEKKTETHSRGLIQCWRGFMFNSLRVWTLYDLNMEAVQQSLVLSSNEKLFTFYRNLVGVNWLYICRFGKKSIHMWWPLSRESTIMCVSLHVGQF